MNCCALPSPSKHNKSNKLVDVVLLAIILVAFLACSVPSPSAMSTTPAIATASTVPAAPPSASTSPIPRADGAASASQSMLFTYLAQYDSKGQLLKVSDSSDRAVSNPDAIVKFPVALGRGLVAIPLKQIAGYLRELTVLEGMAYDKASGQVILFGRNDPSVPTWSTDDLLVAIKSVYTGEEPWVSIDPGPTQGVMLGSYSDPIRNTHFGKVLFEADRLMKNLGLAKDNMTGMSVTSAVPGFKNLIDLSLSIKPGGTEESRHRFWIVVEEMRLEQSSDKQAASFQRVKLRVNTEPLGKDWKPLPTAPIDPAAKAFADHLTAHFDEFTNEQPVFKELVGLAKLVSLAKWTRDSGIPIDLSWAGTQEVGQAETPSITPAITVTGQKQEGNRIQTVTLYGGVDLRVQNQYVPESQQETEARVAALNARTSDAIQTWTFRAGNQNRVAVATGFSPVSKTGGYLTTVQDMKVTDRVPLVLSRRYNSLIAEPSVWGSGWAWSTRRLYFPKPKQTYVLNGQKIELYPEVVWQDPGTGEEHAYKLADQHPQGRIVYNPTEGAERSSLYLKSDGVFVREQPGDPIQDFDDSGKLFRSYDSAGVTITYSYINDRLNSIQSTGGSRIDFTYNPKGWLSEARSSTGEIRRYVYSPQGDLIEVNDGQGKRLAAYEYDRADHLIIERDSRGNLIRSNAYDALGRLTAWSDLQGRYTAKFGIERTEIRHFSNEGPILAQGQISSESRQKPGVQAFLTVAGNEFLPDLAAYEQILRPDVSILYVARKGNQAHLLLDGQYVGVPMDLLIDPLQMKNVLSQVKIIVPQGPVVVLGKGSWNIDFQEVFPGRLPLYAEGLDAAMIKDNLQRVLAKGASTPDKTRVFNFVPGVLQELRAIQFHWWDWLAWDGIKKIWDDTIQQEQYSIVKTQEGLSLQQQFEQSLRESDNVIIVIAHSDGVSIYLPDGTQVTPSRWNEVLRNRPTIIAIGCDIAKITEMTSLAKTFVDKGATAVFAPTIQIEANNTEFLSLFLKYSKSEKMFLDALRKAIEDSRLHFFRLLIGRETPKRVAV